MANKKLTQLTSLTNPKADKCLLYTVDQNDTTDGVGGTSKKVSARTLIEGNIPSPTELSVSGALQSYIDYSLAKSGKVILPPGLITLPNNETINLYKVMGGTIEGAGQSYSPAQDPGWYYADTRAYTIIRKTAGTTPIFNLNPVMNVTFKNFSVQNPGNIGFLYGSVTGWGSAHVLLDSVGAVNTKIFFSADARTTINAADVVFSRCIINNCSVGLEVYHNQGVNWTMKDQCYFYAVEIAVLLRGGGYVHLDNACGYGVKTWVRADQGASNLMPTARITNLYSDRRPPSGPPPVIADFSRSTGPTSIIVDGFRVTDSSEEYAPNYPNSGHPLFLAPTGSSGWSYWDRPTGVLRGGIVIKDLDFMTCPRTFNFEPVRTGNPYGDQGHPKV